MTVAPAAAPALVVIGALDTKGIEIGFVRDRIAAAGLTPLVIDTGVLGTPAITADVTREDVAAAGGHSLADLAARADRGAAVIAMADGAGRVVRRLFDAGVLAGVIGVGGGAGTSVATAAMRALPLGVPKVMVSTLAAGDVSAFVGVSDIVMIPSVVDISGLNRVSRGVLARAAAALCAMAAVVLPPSGDAPIVAATMFGNTTPCVNAARLSLEGQGFEVLVFHATGTGGRSMEALVDAGHVAGVLDVTTTEWADELAGGVMTAGATRLEAAARTGTPAVVAPGCVDMVNFWAPETVPERYRGRRFYQHNADITLMRTTPEENAAIGAIIATKLNASRGSVSVYLPLGGVSILSEAGGPFHWPEADRALFDAIRAGLRADIPVHALDVTINDPAFAAAMVDGLVRSIRGRA